MTDVRFVRFKSPGDTLEILVAPEKVAYLTSFSTKRNWQNRTRIYFIGNDNWIEILGTSEEVAAKLMGGGPSQ